MDRHPALCQNLLAMQAMVLRAPRPVAEGPLEPAEMPEPRPGEGEVKVRVLACGVCHTDLHTVEGELQLPRLPVVPGHQVVGTVEEMGGGCSRLRPGDRVGVAWVSATCGTCDACRRGNENLCPEARFTGLHADGGYAEYCVVREDFAYRIPAGFSDTEAAPLLCAGVIGYRALRLSEIAPGGRLGLYGFGGSAHIAIQVARYWGCEVHVASRGQEHLRLARALGAASAAPPHEPPPVPLDAAVIFAPAGWLVPLALRALRPGGTVACAGIHMSPIPELPYDLLYGERTVRSVANATRRDAEELLALAPRVPIRTEIETFPRAEANRALVLLKESRIRGAAVLV